MECVGGVAQGAWWRVRKVAREERQRSQRRSGSLHLAPSILGGVWPGGRVHPIYRRAGLAVLDYTAIL